MPCEIVGGVGDAVKDSGEREKREKEKKKIDEDA